MAKQSPFTTPQERLERRIKNLENENVALRRMVDPARGVISAQTIIVGDDPAASQVIRVSENGALEVGGVSSFRLAGEMLTVEASHTGDTLETVLHTATVKTNSMGANGCVRISAQFRTIGFLATHTFRMYFGGSLFMEFIDPGAGAVTKYETLPKYVFNKGVTNAQGAGIRFGFRHDRAAADPIFAGAIDTTADVDVTFTVQNANAAHTSSLPFALVEALFRE